MLRPCVARGLVGAVGWRSCINVSGLGLERAVLRATMDISAHASSLADRPRAGHLGHHRRRAVDYADLRRVDGGLGAEAERDHIGDLLLRAGLVVNIEKRRIDRRYPG